MASLGSYCRIATPFKKSGELDEEAFRVWLQRFIKSRIGIYLGSGGAGEGHSLTWNELQRIYEIGVEECRGRIPVCANPPEQYTVRESRAYIEQAIEAGVELVSIYGLASRHGMKPTDLELTCYFKEVLAGVRHPISLAVNQPIMGYLPRPSVIADICNTHRQVVAVNLSLASDGYFIQLMDRLKRDIPVYIQLKGSLNKLMMGARGVFGTEGNIIPRTQRKYLELVEKKKYEQAAVLFADVLRLVEYSTPWSPSSSTPRSLKMILKFLKLPGGEGGVREPYRMPSAKEYHAFTQGLLRLGIPEIVEQARAAGVRIPK